MKYIANSQTNVLCNGQNFIVLVLMYIKEYILYTVRL